MNRMQITLLASTSAVLVLVASRADAIRFKEPVLIQVTFNTEGDVQGPKLRSERPEAITFTSTGDVLGPGSATAAREIYHWELSSRLMQRITFSGSGESYTVTRPTDTTQTTRAEIAAFVSTADLDLLADNSDGNPEIFIWEKVTGAFRQITDTQPPVVNAVPYASDSGRCIVFTSTGDLNDNDGTFNDSANPPTGFSNPDGSQEVFYVQLDTSVHVEPGSITQLTDGPAGSVSGDPVVGGFYYPRQCNIAAFTSDVPQSPDVNGGTQIYNFKRISGERRILASREVFHPNNAPPTGDYLTPNMSSASNFARGPFIVFSTAADLHNNGSNRLNVFRYRVFRPLLIQYTDLDQSDTISPVVSDGGRWIAFESNGELLERTKTADGPFNADGNWEIFRVQGTRKIQQITDTVGCESGQASILDKGVTLAFRSTCDLVPGSNPAGLPQVFLYLQLPKGDVLATAAACDVSEGCCNVANGCYTMLAGRKHKVAKRNCLGSPRACY